MPLSIQPSTGEAFEQDVAGLLEQLLPNCYLLSVPVFRADAAMSPESMANELDFILHLQSGRRHQLLIIECKSCRVTGRGDGRGNFAPPTPSSPWIAHYPRDQKEKSIKDQLRAQRQALLTNLEPLEGEVRIHAVVVATQPEGLGPKPGHITTQELPAFELSLVRADCLRQYLGTLLEGCTALRVQQSEILRRIRQGQPVPALGHPEIYNAIEYTRRCRAFIDSEIFRHLALKPERWAINGSAGMGKSVLLIYVTMVLITDRTIDALRDGTRFLQSYAEEAARLGLADLEKRRVWVLAHTEKQRDMLERMFERFNDLYGEVDSYNEFRRVKPEFHVFSEVAGIDCNILLVDEAHDLGKEDEKRVRDWHASAPGNYLIIACDRHQKLRLSQDETRMIDGLNFSRCTKKLSRNYRNPFPAYAGSLGLLFRWFAGAGPKTLPTPTELKEEFGFGDVVAESRDLWSLRSRNDAHPANNWSHTLSTFPSVEAAYQQLSEFPLRKEHVLWVRFSPEEDDFNYEKLQLWSYHSAFGADSSYLLDKYVKGQEFPVVVIEGVPELLSWTTASGAHPQDLALARVKMWQARRQVYLAASRANVFLYFILPVTVAADVADEFETMFRQLARPPEQASPSGTLWDIRVRLTAEVESFATYVDAIEADPVHPPAEPQTEDVPNSSRASPEAKPPGLVPPSSSLSSAAQPSSAVLAINVPGPDLRNDSVEMSGTAASLERTVRTEPSVSPPEPSPPSIPQSPVRVTPVAYPVPQPIAPSGNTVPAPRSTIPALGPAASLAEVAEVLGCDVADLSRSFAARGFPNLRPTSIVNVGFAKQVFKGATATSTYPANPAARDGRGSAEEVIAEVEAHSKAPRRVLPNAIPQLPSPAMSRPYESPEPIPPGSEKVKSVRLSQLAFWMRLPYTLVRSFLESQGSNCTGPDSIVNADDADKLIRQFVGDRGISAFGKVAKVPIKAKALANHLGLRPHVVARDLMEERLLLSTEDHVPYESMVRLCHFYQKPLPIPPDSGY